MVEEGSALCLCMILDSTIKLGQYCRECHINTIDQQTIRLYKINDALQNDKTNSIRTSCLKMYYLFLSAKHTYICRNTHVCTLSSHNNINFTRSKTLYCLQYKLRMSNRCFILLASLHNNCCYWAKYLFSFKIIIDILQYSARYTFSTIY